MLFLLALLFFPLGTSVTPGTSLVPMNQQYPDAVISQAVVAFSADHYVKPDELPSRRVGCWAPVVSERCSFNVTSFEP
jgi:hypothetical protein